MSCIAALEVGIKKICLRIENFFFKLFFFWVRPFFYMQDFLSNARLRFGCEFLLNPGNITPFIRCNKQTDRARREMHFLGNESSKMLWKI